MSLLDNVTPVILTYQEAPNIGRALASLAWAAEIVVVDSGSTDATRATVDTCPRARFIERPFDNHKRQWEYAIKETGVRTEFVLALDADMRPSEAMQKELAHMPDQVDWNGASIPFEYEIRGVPLGRSLYPAQVRLVRGSAATVLQRGHTQHIQCPPPVIRLRGALIHDDRKPLDDFLRAQVNYARLEWARLKGEGGSMRWVDRVRRKGSLLGLLGMACYVGLRIGPCRSNPARRRYWIERMLFELILRYHREDESLQAVLPPSASSGEEEA